MAAIWLPERGVLFSGVFYQHGFQRIHGLAVPLTGALQKVRPKQFSVLDALNNPLYRLPFLVPDKSNPRSYSWIPSSLAFSRMDSRSSKVSGRFVTSRRRADG